MYFNLSTFYKLSKGMIIIVMTAMIIGASSLMILRAGQREVYSVQSGSMAPTINRGDAVVLSRKYPDLQRGDIVTYQSARDAGTLITHRIVRVEHDTGKIITQGDGSAYADNPIARQQVVGQVSHVLPFTGYVLDAYRHPIGLVFALYLPAAIIIAGELRRLARYYSTRHYVLRSYLHHVPR